MKNRRNFDVLVAGGGTAGVVAAIQSARAGARTLLVEKTGMLGGTVTNAGVTAVSCFNAYGRQVIAGIGWEMVCRSFSEVGEAPPDFSKHSPKNGCLLCVVNLPVFAAVADEMVIESGAEVLMHAMPAVVAKVPATDRGSPGVGRDLRARPDAAQRSASTSGRLDCHGNSGNPDGGSWRVTLCTKNGLTEVGARVLVDCTGDANVVTMAGLEVERNNELQPATLVMRLDGYDPAALDIPAIQAAFDRAVESGELLRSDPGWQHGNIGSFLRWRGGNCIHVVDVDGSTSEGRTRAEMESRKVMMRLFRFLRRQPGLSGLRISSCAAETGIRETVTIKGRRKITVADYESGRLWDDAVCYSFYPVDVHTAEGLIYRVLPEGVVPTIPFGALLPESGRNIAVAGRCIAGDREANSAYRVQSTCMATGQAAGAAAALAVKRGVDVADVSLADLRALLKEHGAIVPE